MRNFYFYCLGDKEDAYTATYNSFNDCYIVSWNKDFWFLEDDWKYDSANYSKEEVQYMIDNNYWKVL